MNRTPTDPYIDDDVKAYVLGKIRTDGEGNIVDTPQQMVLRSQAAMIEVSKLLRILITETHLARVAACRHHAALGGPCGVPPCAAPPAATGGPQVPGVPAPFQL